MIPGLNVSLGVVVPGKYDFLLVSMLLFDELLVTCCVSVLFCLCQQTTRETHVQCRMKGAVMMILFGSSFFSGDRSEASRLRSECPQIFGRLKRGQLETATKLSRTPVEQR
jgi:hypothetical protein